MMALRVRFARGQAADPETARLAGEYLAWFIPSLALQFAMVATGAALRGIGDFKPGMIVQSATVVVNIVLAPVLMFGWGTGHPLGVAGTALASFIAVVGRRGGADRLRRAHARLPAVRARANGRRGCALWGRMLAIGLPAGAEFALMGVYMVVIYAITRPVRRGRAGGFRHRPARGPGGLHAGGRARLRGQPGRGTELRRAPGRARARRRFASAALMATVAMMAACALICRFVPGTLVGIFSRDPGVLAVGGEYLRIVVVELHPVGDRVRQLQHVPGAGQHDAAAGQLVRSARRCW